MPLCLTFQTTREEGRKTNSEFLTEVKEKRKPSPTDPLFVASNAGGSFVCQSGVARCVAFVVLLRRGVSVVAVSLVVSWGAEVAPGRGSFELSAGPWSHATCVSPPPSIPGPGSHSGQSLSPAFVPGRRCPSFTCSRLRSSGPVAGW